MAAVTPAAGGSTPDRTAGSGFDTGASPTELVAALEPILPLVAHHAPWSNEHRRPHPEVFGALAGAGLLRMIAPAHYGGLGGGPEAFLAVVETLARVDGSTAWVAMTLNEEVGIASSYLPPATMTELLQSEPDVIIAGSGIAHGQARRTEGGWRVDGRWPFVSGSPVADRVVVGCRIVGEDGRPVPGRQLCFPLIPATELTIEDTWHTAGLRGTGSNDVIADDVFVPERWAGVTSFGATALPDTPYYQLPAGLRFPWPKVGVAAGLAGAAIDAFAELASTKKPSLRSAPLAERPTAQAAVAKAEALVGSGRAWVLAVLEELWAAADAADGAEPLDPKLHARGRLAASSAVDAAIRAVDGLASAAGTSASKLDGPWPRLQADVRSVGQHFMVGPQQIQTAGRVLLGLDADDPAF